MKLNVYAIYDSVSGAYAQPHCAVNDASACRGVSDLIARDQNLATHVGDYTLFKLGEYDDSTGRITGLEQPEMVARCSSLDRRAQQS